MNAPDKIAFFYLSNLKHSNYIVITGVYYYEDLYDIFMNDFPNYNFDNSDFTIDKFINAFKKIAL